ncbi:hypothetical protein [Leifsonia aquatica]|uniref:hypothetical protein n=1 Tax=Leifsonia aquatica TaxID=144185 RepID=UPI0037F823D8
MPVPHDEHQELRESIRAQLLAGGAHANLSEISVPLATWRALARKVAHELNRPVVTTATDYQAWASFKDWGLTPAEKDIGRELLRRAVDGTAKDALGR